MIPPNSPPRRLTPEIVREIRRVVAANEVSRRALARRYGVSLGNVQDIVNFKYWKWVR